MSPAAKALQPVPFHGDTIYAVEHDGQPFTPAKPIIENMGIAWTNQRIKLRDNKERWGVMEIIIPSPGGPQKMLCIPVRKLAGFLATISAHRCRRPDLQGKILAYQAECDNALWAYWSTGRAVNPRATARIELPAAKTPMVPAAPPLKAPGDLMNEAFMELRRESAEAMAALLRRVGATGKKADFVDKILRYRSMGLNLSEIAKLLGCNRSTIHQYEKLLKTCGYETRTPKTRRAIARITEVAR